MLVFIYLTGFLFGNRILSNISHSQELVSDISCKLALEILNLSWDPCSATFHWKFPSEESWHCLEKVTFPEYAFPFCFISEGGVNSFLGGKEFPGVCWDDGSHQAGSFPHYRGTWQAPVWGCCGFIGVCRGKELCCELFTWLWLNPEQEVLGNHSEMDKQQFVMLTLVLTVSVVAILRKVQAVERRWVRWAGRK